MNGSKASDVRGVRRDYITEDVCADGRVNAQVHAERLSSLGASPDGVTDLLRPHPAAQ
jgi:hypothetical protein